MHDISSLVQSAERLPMKFSKLVEHVSKRPIPPHTKHLLVEVMLMDEEGEDVEVCSSRCCCCTFPVHHYFTGAIHPDPYLRMPMRSNQLYYTESIDSM